MTQQNILSAILLALVACLVFSLIGTYMIVNSQDDSDFVTSEDLTLSIDNLKLYLVEVSANTTDVIEDDYILSKSEYEDNMAEDKALELAEESLNSRDFKRAIFDALVSAGADIESYKDITEISILDIDVDGDEVKVDAKVFYFIEDDKSEEYKSRLTEFTIEIDDLDFDDDFEDAEVNEEYMDELEVRYIREA